jgi:hypothetical protein
MDQQNFGNTIILSDQIINFIVYSWKGPIMTILYYFDNNISDSTSMVKSTN